MKRYIWIPLLLLAALASAEVTPKSLQSVLQGGTRTLAPNATTDAVTINNGVLGRFPLHSTARLIPTASSTVAGLVKIGSGLAMNNGVLNNTGMAGVASFNGRAGAVKPGFSDYSASMIKGLATVAKTGSYADLTGKPPIPAAQVNSDWNASSGVAQILNKPTIPTALSQLSQSPDYRTVTDADKAKWDLQSNAVTTVNGMTGDVVLTATSVLADPIGAATSVQSNLDLHAGLINNPHQVTKTQVGLGNADNTSDLNKPVSTATQTALDAKVASTAFAAYTTVDRLPTSVFASYSATRMAKVNPVYSGTLSTTNDNGTHRLNVLNTVSRAYTPIEGDVDTDSNGKLWIYHSGAWGEKGAAYTLPAATTSALGGVKVGNTLQINAGVLDVMVSSLGPTGLVTAGLAGDQTISSGFAYVTTQTGKWTFNSYTSSKQTTLFANYSGTLCAATGSKLYWPNPVTFANQSSLCAGVPKGARVTAQHQGGKTYATGTKNLQKIVTAIVPTGYSDDFTGTDNTALLTHDSNWSTFSTTYPASNLKISGGKLTTTSASTGGAAYYTPSSSDTSQITVLTPTGSEEKRAVVRASSSTVTGYNAFLNTVSAGNFTKINIQKGSTVLVSTAVSISSAVDHTLKLTASGTSPVTLTAYVDGVQVGTTTDSTSPIASGHPGLYLIGTGTAANNYIDAWRDY